MSKKTIIAATTALLAAAGIIALGSCSSDDEVVQTNYPADNIVRIDAGVNNMITRASAETSNLSTIGFSITNSNNTTYSYNNIKVTKSGDSWTPASQMLWQNATQPVDVIAYAPYNESYTGTLATATDFEVNVATEQKADTYESDFLVYKKAGLTPNTDLDNKGAVPITFTHALSQLEVQVVFGTEFDDDEALTATPIGTFYIGGTYVKGKCDFTQDTPKVSVVEEDDAKKDVAPYEVAGSFVAAEKTAAGEVSNASVKYSCILIPQTVTANNFKVTLGISSKTFAWTAPSVITLEGGYKYTLKLTVGKDYVVAGEMTATPWTDGGEQSLETD